MDIIRRVLESYFGYKVNFVQNITDIDDKVYTWQHTYTTTRRFISSLSDQIILRARQQYLFNELKRSTTQLDESLIQQVESSWNDYAASKLAKVEGAVSAATADWASFEQKMTAEEMAKAILLDEKFKMNFSALVNCQIGMMMMVGHGDSICPRFPFTASITQGIGGSQGSYHSG